MLHTLPQYLLQLVFDKLQSDAICDRSRSCVNLALTCSACNIAFVSGARQKSCKDSAVKRLLRWRALSESCSGRLKVRAVLPSRKTTRLIQWLDDGYITIEDLWTAQQPTIPQHSNAPNILILILEENFLKGRILTSKEKTQLKIWMAQFVTFASPPFDHVFIYHDPPQWPTARILICLQTLRSSVILAHCISETGSLLCFCTYPYMPRHVKRLQEAFQGLLIYLLQVGQQFDAVIPRVAASIDSLVLSREHLLSSFVESDCLYGRLCPDVGVTLILWCQAAADVLLSSPTTV